MTVKPAGGTDYATYLLIDDLLALQRPLTPEAHDELLFIIVHQAYELWFKLMLHELDLAEKELRDGRPAGAIGPLKRVVATTRVLEEQLQVLETMGPEGFMEFRDPLAPASGFQSRQFREIEASAGPLWEAFSLHVDDLADLYRNHKQDPQRAVVHLVAELLIDFDEAFARWRHHHVLMAAREIGSRPGTGGSHGVEYLKTTLDQRFFPRLWEVRSEL
jgi:tryptophan 2,3-dioxygenase